ncbi:MAG: HAMP domain-containing histidine kinase [Cyanobacteria bacterium SIG30]|nr:HAMP domain-containing histidine kinase [Cyanobacteria bacterium SIG30]
MIYILILSLIINLIAVCCIFYLIFKHKKLLKSFKKEGVFLKKITNSINSVRYGNIYERTTKGYNKETKDVSNSLNGLFESISDREKMLKEYAEKENEANILKNDFMAALTHDLKVPIIAQDNTFDLLLSNKFGEISQLQKEVIEKLKISNIDLKYLVNILLETYKMEQTKLEIQRTKGVLLENFIKDIISQLDSFCDVHNKIIDFKNELYEEVSADIDTFLIKRVIQNLIINAISYDKRSNKIDITLKKYNEDSFAISIKDYGVGIDEKEIKKIFKKYYSGSNKFSRSGVGLGLYLSNKIVKLHGGKIDVISKENEGSEFSIILNFKESKQ